MQDYIALRVDANPCNETITDLVAAFLGEIGFESFTPDETGLIAYIQDHLYNKKAVDEVLTDFPIETKFTLSAEKVEGQDWNEEWEKHYFQPIIVDNKCVVHSSFHKDIPAAPYDIVIDPKMAFGTGHHATTSNMMRFILEADLKGKSVIDMGTGTGILAILCKMKGADKVTGIEIDPFAWENAVENTHLNHTDIEMICGDAEQLKSLAPADFFLANINRNVITSDISSYSAALKIGGTMYLSGFYRVDIPIVEKVANNFGLKLVDIKEENDWVAVKFKKS
ncbi:MAG: 50S ribosomal protein L11 methyltransferase [Bacteroides sp.]|nr:50S ribosomal protein L11 methyltransferase [Bacteroides sp.]